MHLPTGLVDQVQVLGDADRQRTCAGNASDGLQMFTAIAELECGVTDALLKEVRRCDPRGAARLSPHS